MALGTMAGKIPAQSSIAVNNFLPVIVKRSDATITAYATSPATISVAKANCAKFGHCKSKDIKLSFDNDQTEVINFNVDYAVTKKNSITFTALQSFTNAEITDVEQNQWCLMLIDPNLLTPSATVGTLVGLGASVLCAYFFDYVTFTAKKTADNAKASETEFTFAMSGKSSLAQYVAEAVTITLT